MVESIVEALRGSPPWMYLLALSFLPLIGVPLSALWLITGAAFGPRNGFLLIMGGMVVNFALAYLIANRWLRGPLTRLFEKRGIKIPEAKPAEFVKLTIAIRIFPGLPNVMQSYLLGLANVPFRIYYPLSFPPQIAIAVGFVMFGNSLANMEGGGLIMAALIIVAAGLLMSIIRKRRAAAGDLDQLTP